MQHAKDLSGKFIKKGHRVHLPGTVIDISETPGHFDTQVLLDRKDSQGKPTVIPLYSQQVEIKDDTVAAEEITVGAAMLRLRKEINEDSGRGSYRDTWLSNIAMPILALSGKLDLTTHEGVNAMAEILLNHFFPPIPAEVVEPEKPAGGVRDSMVGHHQPQPPAPPAGKELIQQPPPGFMEEEERKRIAAEGAGSRTSPPELVEKLRLEEEAKKLEAEAEAKRVAAASQQPPDPENLPPKENDPSKQTPPPEGTGKQE